jgi:hypothetical protein
MGLINLSSLPRCIGIDLAVGMSHRQEKLIRSVQTFNVQETKPVKKISSEQMVKRKRNRRRTKLDTSRRMQAKMDKTINLRRNKKAVKREKGLVSNERGGL